MIFGFATLIVLKSVHVAISICRPRRMAKLFPMDSKETKMGVDGRDNSLADIGGGTLEIRRGVNLSVSTPVNLDK